MKTKIPFSQFLDDFNKCLTALTGLTDPFGNWYDGYTITLTNNFDFSGCKTPLPFFVYIFVPYLKKGKVKSIKLMLHIPCLKQKVGKDLAKMLYGLGYSVDFSPKDADLETDMLFLRLTKFREGVIIFDEELLLEQGLVENAN